MSGFILHNNRILQSKSIDYEVIDDFPVYEVQPGLSYTRPSDWLALPSVSEGDQVIHMLVAVYDSDKFPNWLGFTVGATSPTGAGTYSVNWGDGYITGAAASNTTSKYEIQWSSINSGTLTSRGYRQVIVTITATQGSNLTSFYLKLSPSAQLYTPTTTGGVYSQNTVPNSVLDIKMAGITFSSISIGDDYTVVGNVYNSYSIANMLEQFEFVGTNSITSFANMFRSLKSLRKVKELYTGLGTNMSQMFYNCNNLIELPTRFDTRNVTNMYAMFGQCLNINRIPGMTTSNVTNMEQMFIRCINLDIAPYFDTGNVTNMRYMFSHCHILDKFEGWNFLSYPIVSVWYDTKNVTNMDGMFWRCHRLQTIPQFNTTNVATMSYMFYQNASLQSIPGLTTSNVKTMRGMFYQCRSLVNDTRMNGLPYMDTANVIDMKEMFFQCHRVKTIPLFNTEKVLDMSLMFYDCISLQEVPLLNTATCSSMYQMFALCQRLETIPQFNTANVMTMARMFYDCYNLREIPLLNTSNVINMSQMFFQTVNRGRLKTIPLLDTSNVRSMYMMFYNNRSLQNIPQINTSNLRTMFQMFIYCINLREIKMPGLTALGVGVGTGMDSFMTGTGSNALPINSSKGGIVTDFYKVVNSYSGPPAASSDSTGTAETTIAPYYIYEPNFNNAQYIPKPQTNTYYGSTNPAYPVPANGSVDNYYSPQSTNFTSLFYQCYSLRKVEINAPTVNYVTTMFYECVNLRKGLSLTFSSTSLALVGMFQKCYNLKEAPMFNTAGVTDMSLMFRQCYELTSVPLYNTINVTTMANMFNCYDDASYPRSVIKSIPLFDTRNVTVMTAMFQGCKNLVTIPAFNTIKLITADNMFKECYNLRTLPLLNLPAVSNLKYAFQYCYSLEYVPAIFTYSSASIDMTQTFEYCSSLRYLESPFLSKPSTLYATFNLCPLLERIPSINTTSVSDFRFTFRGCKNLTALPEGFTMSANGISIKSSIIYGDGSGGIYTYAFISGANKLGYAPASGYTQTMFFNKMSFKRDRILDIFNKAGVSFGTASNFNAWRLYVTNLDQQMSGGNSNAYINTGWNYNQYSSPQILDIRLNQGTALLTYVDRVIAYNKWWVLPGYSFYAVHDTNTPGSNDQLSTSPNTLAGPIQNMGSDRYRVYPMFYKFLNTTLPPTVNKTSANNSMGEYACFYYPEPANTDKHSIDNGAPSNNILDLYNSMTYDYWTWRISSTYSQSLPGGGFLSVTASQTKFLSYALHALTHSVYDVGNQHKYDLTTYVNQLYSVPTLVFATASYRTIGAIYDLNIGKNWYRRTIANASPLSNVWFKFQPSQTGTIGFSVWSGPSYSGTPNSYISFNANDNVIYGTQRRSQIAIWESDGVTELASSGWSYSSANPFALAGVPTYSVEHMPVTASCMVNASTWYYISVDTAVDGYQGTFTLATWWI